MSTSAAQVIAHSTRIRRRDLLFAAVGLFTLLAVLLLLAAVFVRLALDGWPRLDLDFLLRFASRHAPSAGVLAAWVGSLLVLVVTALAAVPIGIGAAIWLEEYAPRHWLATVVELNVANLAGVPSVVFGLLALSLLVQRQTLGPSVLAAGLTLAMMILPMVIVSSREALRSVPLTLREAAFGLGATRWQVVRDHLLPGARAGMLTGIILSLARAVGETAPLIVIGALSFIAFLPPAPLMSTPPYFDLDWLHSPFSVLPVQMFHWLSRADAGFHVNAAAAGVVLLGVTLCINGFAIWLRHQARRNLQW